VTSAFLPEPEFQASPMLAARYVFLSKGNPELPSEYKKQLFQYIKESGIPLDQMIKLFIFVRNFVHLPEPLEKDFLNLQKSLVFQPSTSCNSQKALNKWHSKYSNGRIELNS
jgi:hypothetical protein